MSGPTMVEDLNTPTAWENVSNAHSDINGSPITYVHSGPAHPDLAPNSSPIPASSSEPPSPPTRSSFDSASKWTDNISVTLERRDTTLSTIPSDAASLVEPSFDENVLRALCDLDVSIDPANPRLRSLMYDNFNSVEFHCYWIE